MVIQPWCTCDKGYDDLIISSFLFCLHPTFDIKLPEGTAALFTPTVELWLALDKNIFSRSSGLEKPEGYWLQVILWDTVCAAKTTGLEMNAPLHLGSGRAVWLLVELRSALPACWETCTEPHSPLTFLLKGLYVKRLLLVHVWEDNAIWVFTF